ncbi:hypothetical protein FACS1894202_06970 [Clostridia bacterium]|nr:hypothetical protein FACS1894202_06970 [Clostridia bacterium]
MAQTKEQIREITAKLEQGVMELFESGKYEDYLRTMSRFHRYSTRNVLLIHQQYPDATLVAGFNTWRNNFNRRVKKGEHGIRIFAPIPSKVHNIGAEEIDPTKNQTVLDDFGQPIMERFSPASTQVHFKVVTVFDAKQTEGDPLPELAETLTGDVERYELFMDALRAVSPLPIVFEPMNDKDGYCAFGDKIGIREGMSQIQTVSAVVHEMTHSLLHDRNSLDEGAEVKDRRVRECEAESCAYSTLSYFGIDTGANSFGYLLEWAKSRELKELKASLDVIRKTTAELIDSIDTKYRELAKERGIDLSVVTDEIGAEQNYNMIDGVINNTPPIATTETPITEETPETGAAAQAAKSPAATNEPAQDEPENRAASDILAPYVRNAEVRDPRPIGETILMTLLFEDGNLNRTGKRSRVKVEPPIGKYEMFSRDEGTPPRQTNYLYAMTASGKLADLGETERLKDLTETQLDDYIIRLDAAFAKQLAAPTEWADFTAAAFLDRIGEAETHNVPVRELREAERQAEREAQREQDKQFAAERRGIFDSRVDEIAKAIENGGSINVAYDAREYDGKNPVLELFRFYGVELPLRTQGWINTTLAAITAQGYSRYTKVGGKKRGESERFGECLDALKKAVKLMPIEQKREQFSQQTPQRREKTKMSIEQENYAKFAELFPDFISQKYSYMKLESPGLEPLSLEWIFGDRISVMHTYTMNGDLMYDPMIEFSVNSVDKTMTATKFEQSMPPLYQYPDDNGQWHSVDGNGRDTVMKNLQTEISAFSAQWFSNLKEQAHIPVRATLWNEGNIDDVDVRVTFDKDGNAVIDTPEEQRKPVGYLSFADSGEVMAYYSADEILAAYKREMGSLGADGVRYRGVIDEDLEQKLYAAYAGEYGEDIAAPEKPGKEYDLGYGHLGNGVTVWNRAEERDHDYVTVAHIERDRSVTFYDKDMPADVKAQIEKEAKTMDINISATQSGKVFSTPPEKTEPIKEADKFIADIGGIGNLFGAPTPPPKVQAKNITDLDLSLPDPTVSAAERNEYGYAYDGMLPMTAGRAVELFDTDHPIYLLYPDGTEAMALDREEIRLFDGLCGIESDDWHNSAVYKAQIGIAEKAAEKSAVREAARANDSNAREADLLYGDNPYYRENKFGIYQIRDDIDEARNFRSASMKELEAHGLTVNRDNYELVYTAALTHRIEYLTDIYPALNRLYEQFNVDHPADYAGRSLSVGDVLVLRCNGDITAHFVDSTGFVELSSFTGDEHTDNSFSQVGKSPTVAELEADVKAGKSISLMDLSRAVKSEPQKPFSKGKPSILDDLAEAEKIAESGGRQNNNKKTERGYD